MTTAKYRPVDRVPPEDIAKARAVCRRIARDVEAVYGVPRSLVFAKTRGCPRVSTARHLVWLRAYKRDAITLSAIAAVFQRDHGNVFVATRKNEHSLCEFLRRRKGQPLVCTEADTYAKVEEIVGENFETRKAFDAMRAHLLAGGDRALWAYFARKAWPYAPAAMTTLPAGVGV